MNKIIEVNETIDRIKNKTNSINDKIDKVDSFINTYKNLTEDEYKLNDLEEISLEQLDEYALSDEKLVNNKTVILKIKEEKKDEFTIMLLLSGYKVSYFSDNKNSTDDFFIMIEEGQEKFY